MPDVFTYVAFNEDGFARAMVRDDPKFKADTGKRVAEFIAEGRRVERMSWDAMQSAMKAGIDHYRKQ